MQMKKKLSSDEVKKKKKKKRNLSYRLLDIFLEVTRDSLSPSADKKNQFRTIFI